MEARCRFRSRQRWSFSPWRSCSSWALISFFSSRSIGPGYLPWYHELCVLFRHGLLSFQTAKDSGFCVVFQGLNSEINQSLCTCGVCFGVVSVPKNPLPNRLKLRHTILMLMFLGSRYQQCKQRSFTKASTRPSSPCESEESLPRTERPPTDPGQRISVSLLSNVTGSAY